MKKLVIALGIVMVCLLSIHLIAVRGADNQVFQTYEYVTIRWAGRENTHVIRANGKVEFLTAVLGKTQRPDRTDDRAFYMNLAMNAVAREGYEFAGMTHDEIVMRRALGH
jgi:hypothetical protein